MTSRHRHHRHYYQPLATRYVPEFNPLWEPDLPPDQQPNVIGRARFGRIAIANSDAGRAAYTAIDQAHWAVGELLALPS